MSPSLLAMAASIRCSPVTSGWRKCRPADRCGCSRSGPSKRFVCDADSFRQGGGDRRPCNSVDGVCECATRDSPACRRRTGEDRSREIDLCREMLALPRPEHGQFRHGHPRSAPVSGRPTALRHHCEAGEEQQDAALGRHPERRRHRKPLGLCVEPEDSMRSWMNAIGAGALLATAFAAAPASPAAAFDEVLKVCLNEDLPPLSVHHRGKPGAGFDVALAEAVAKQLGRPLQIQWFESKLDEDSSPALEANALLSDGRCALIGSYALTKDSLVVPGMKTA